VIADAASLLGADQQERNHGSHDDSCPHNEKFDHVPIIPGPHVPEVRIANVGTCSHRLSSI
jgi:hypothetical protein